MPFDFKNPAVFWYPSRSASKALLLFLLSESYPIWGPLNLTPPEPFAITNRFFMIAPISL